MNLKNKVGQRIKRLRNKAGVTQEDLSDKAGISVDFLSLVERGRNAPSLETVEKIAKALNIHIKEIFSEDE